MIQIEQIFFRSVKVWNCWIVILLDCYIVGLLYCWIVILLDYYVVGMIIKKAC